MKAAYIERNGGPEVFKYGDLPDPKPGPGDVVVDIVASTVNGADWNVEMGSITQMLTEKSNGTAPAILFDEIPGYPKGFRTLYGHFSSIKRVALTLGLPLQLFPDIEEPVITVFTGWRSASSEWPIREETMIASTWKSRRICSRMRRYSRLATAVERNGRAMSHVCTGTRASG